MPRFLLDAVTDHAARLKLGGSDVLCRTPRGTFVRRDQHNREVWKPAITATGLPAGAPVTRWTTRSVWHACAPKMPPAP